MKFRNGYLGVVVVMVALAGALIGSWALSSDVTEVDKTTYNQIADITPLFGAEQAPDFISYNPSTNYTGYYTDNSTMYWDGVDYDTSSRANSYKLNLAPTLEVSNTLDLSQITGDSSENWTLYYWPNVTGIEQSVEHLDISSLVTALSLESYDEINIISDTGNWTTGGFFSFCTSAMENNPVSSPLGHIISLKSPTVEGNVLKPNTLATFVDSTNVSVPILACSYSILSNTVQLYSDVNMTQSVGIFNPVDVYVIWSNSTSPGFHLGNSGDVEAKDLPPAEYLDITEGVELL